MKTRILLAGATGLVGAGALNELAALGDMPICTVLRRSAACCHARGGE